MRNPLDAAISFIHDHRPTRAGRFVAPYLLVVVTILLGLSLYQTASTRDFADQLRDGLVESCQENGNPLREAVTGLLEDQIKRSEETPSSYFPDIPPDVFDRLVQEQVEANRRTISAISPVDCPAQYP